MLRSGRTIALVARLAAVVALLAGGVVGCSSVDSQVSHPPPAGLTTLAIGRIEAPQLEAEAKVRPAVDAGKKGVEPTTVSQPGQDEARLIRRFRRELIARLEKAKAFEAIVSPMPSPSPPGATIFSGQFTELDFGSDALRFIIGGGTGEPSVRGRFEVRDEAGQVLVRFEQKAGGFGRAYSSQLNAVDIDALIDGLAARTANEIIARRKTGPIKDQATDNGLRASR